LRRRQPVLIVTRNEHATAITRALELLDADVAAPGGRVPCRF
jgi:hypothetical protein